MCGVAGAIVGQHAGPVVLLGRIAFSILGGLASVVGFRKRRAKSQKSSLPISSFVVIEVEEVSPWQVQQERLKLTGPDQLHRLLLSSTKKDEALEVEFNAAKEFEAISKLPGIKLSAELQVVDLQGRSFGYLHKVLTKNCFRWKVVLPNEVGNSRLHSEQEFRSSAHNEISILEAGLSRRHSPA